MSASYSTSQAEQTARPRTAATNSQRVLACVRCHRRKLRCDRTFPCANCVMVRSECVPATLLPRQRRRRFSERELLERLRRYESLLRQHRITWEPLHESPANETSLGEEHESAKSPTDGISEATIDGAELLSKMRPSTPPETLYA